jgi:ClpX C4-type zinc finger protein
MPLDPNLLDRAKIAGSELVDAERTALLARADYHTAIRRLHLAGASLREIADALSLSHQRVQQVVTAAGGSWWQVWRRRTSERDAVCTWCERPPSEVSKLIAGPKVYICDSCVGAAERAVKSTATEDSTLRTVSAATRHRCSFCRKRGTESRALVIGPANVCAECLAVCREILDSRAA